jgi:hypothetical protein
LHPHSLVIVGFSVQVASPAFSSCTAKRHATHDATHTALQKAACVLLDDLNSLCLRRVDELGRSQFEPASSIHARQQGRFRHYVRHPRVESRLALVCVLGALRSSLLWLRTPRSRARIGVAQRVSDGLLGWRPCFADGPRRPLPCQMLHLPPRAVDKLERGCRLTGTRLWSLLLVRGWGLPRTPGNGSVWRRA